MIKSTKEVKVYFITMPAHKFLHIKNYESNGYWDFSEKQEKIPGQGCHEICGLLNSISGRLDSKADDTGNFSGHIMAHIYENNGKIAEAYGVRLSINFVGQIPENMYFIDIPEMEYIVFEHGPFNYEEENESVGIKLEEVIKSFDYSKTEYKLDTSSGRIGYFYHYPEIYMKHIKPVIKK